MEVSIFSSPLGKKNSNHTTKTKIKLKNVRRKCLGCFGLIPRYLDRELALGHPKLLTAEHRISVPICTLISH